MYPLPLFIDVVEPKRQHPMYCMIRDGDYQAERQLLLDWSAGFIDRDKKFVKEFQTSFEPCLWELYLHAYLKNIGAEIDFSHNAPDFVAKGLENLCIEATIAAPANGDQGPIGYSFEDLPKDLNLFNSQSTLRICNSFSSKVKKLRESYINLPQCENKPFAIAIASYDRPFSHMAAMRPIISALYGLYHDEEETIRLHSPQMVSYNITGVRKNKNTDIDLGYFCNSDYSDVSAVVYSSLATWGKVRALADNPNAKTIYKTFHPNSKSIHPIVKTAKKSNYKENLMDGLMILHNPFAKHKLDPKTLAHERIAQCFVEPDGELKISAPDDFLLMRSLFSIKSK